jgi:hypothetical protein
MRKKIEGKGEIAKNRNSVERGRGESITRF